jgi:hypothetical protein
MAKIEENDAMDLVYYAAVAYPNRATLLAHLQADAPVERFVPCGTVEELDSSLLRPLSDVLAVVLLPTDDADLARILTLREVLTSTRIILILPTWDPDLVTGARFLRPRFMTTRDTGFREVSAVLQKMAKDLGCSSHFRCTQEETNVPHGSRNSQHG